MNYNNWYLYLVPNLMLISDSKKRKHRVSKLEIYYDKKQSDKLF